MSAAPRAVSAEELISLVRSKRRARLIMRIELRRNGLLQDGLHDREQRAWNELEQFLAKCLVCWPDVTARLSRVAVDPINDSDLLP